MINHCSRRGEGEEPGVDRGCLGGERGRAEAIAKKVTSGVARPRSLAFDAIANRPKDARFANTARGQRSL